MPLPTPNLDDRRFQEILDEARRRIPLYCPEWTDHNLSDPGVTLLELFAWMTDLLLYRLNRVPDKNYVKFLELVGVRLEPARPATADLTFRLAAPQPEDVVIPRGTEVGTLRTEAHEGITFATDQDLVIRLPELVHLLTSREGARFHDYQPALANPSQGLGVFSETPQEDDALYFGFSDELSAHTVAISLECRMEGIGVDPNDPPLVWETWDATEGCWERVRLNEDSTGGLNREGVVILDIPLAASPTAVDGKLAFWIRCRVLRPRPGQAGYGSSPRVTGVLLESIGGSVPASHAFRVFDEVLGTSDGTPGQTFALQTPPVLRRSAEETLEVQGDDGTFERWVEVPDFGLSGPDDPHFTLDDVSGSVQFGPRIRTPQGVERQYGKVPPSGRTLRFSSYRSGGGVEGNVGARTLSVLKSSIPYVAWVNNLEAATGGTDAEDIEHAKWRGSRVLRSLERAVTVEDFERLAHEASPAVGRARCIMIGAGADGARGLGVVRLLLVPKITDADGPVRPDDLQLPGRVKRQVEAYLDDRRLLTCELVLDSPRYVWVRVAVRVRARPQADSGRVAHAVNLALYRYLHPTRGGPDGTGWDFGRELFAGDVYSQLQQLDGIALIDDVTLHEIDPLTGRVGPATTHIALTPDALVCSHDHQVDVQPVVARWT